jgi:hypothetical protein
MAPATTLTTSIGEPIVLPLTAARFITIRTPVRGA